MMVLVYHSYMVVQIQEDLVNYYPPITDNTDDGSCIFLGCTDPTATNYDPNFET